MNSFLNGIYGVCIIAIAVTTTIKAFSIIHISSLSILALLTSFSYSTNAAFYQKLIGDDHPIGGQYFGRGTAMGDNITFVGARGANSWQGAVYVFAKNTTTESWQHKQKLIPSDSGEIVFGHSLDFDEANRVLIVGGPWRNAYQGSAYIFNEDINGYWQQSQLLVPPGAGASDYCGTSVSIENNVAVVGCHGDDDVIRDGGAVNIYEYDGYNWAFAAKIVIPDPASTGEYFGVSTDISNGVIVVGANGYGASEGAAYIIEKEGTWGITHALHPPFVITGLSFGYDVCIDGDTIAISATFSTGAGRVYLYTRDEQNALNKTDEIQASDVEEEEENRRFGGSMSLYNNTLVVGSPYDDEHATEAGSFYIFERVEGSWTPITKLMPDVSSVALLGYENSLTVYKNSIVVGAPLDDTGGTVSGSAFIYERYGSGFEWIPTEAPSNAPSQPPTQPPSSAPSDAPSQPPSSAPSQAPSDAPSQSPTQPPSRAPSQSPTQPPSSAPSQPPSTAPSVAPTESPTTCLDYDEDVGNNGEDEYLMTVSGLLSLLAFRHPVSINHTKIAESGDYINDVVVFENDEIQQLDCIEAVSCFQTKFDFINNTNCNIRCAESLSCYGSQISISKCANVDVICNGVQACDGANIAINVTEDAATQITIDCGAETSCINMGISIAGARNGNATATISCIDYGACDDINIEIELDDVTKSRLKMYSYSSNVWFNNDYGWASSDRKQKYIDCATRQRSIPWRSGLNKTELETLIAAQYSHNIYPCFDVHVACISEANQTTSSSACTMHYDALESFNAPPSVSPTHCLYVPIEDMIRHDCLGSCWNSPTEKPTKVPSSMPTISTTNPTVSPTMDPTTDPTIDPTYDPTLDPTAAPTTNPSSPSQPPTMSPSIAPSNAPSLSPTIAPTDSPSMSPSNAPSYSPSSAPTRVPTTDKEELYDASIPITYIIAKLDDTNMDLLEDHSGPMVRDIVEQIERGYFDDIVPYTDFMIRVDAVNGFNVNNVNLKYDGNVTLESIIFCKSQIAETLIRKTQNAEFKEDVTAYLMHYFNLTQIPNTAPITNASAVNPLQFIVVNEQDVDFIVETEEEEPPESYVAVALAAVIIGIGLTLAVFVKYQNKKPDAKVDNAKWQAPLLLSFQIYDFVSDINLCFDILSNPAAFTGESRVNIILLCGICAVLFTVLPYFVNVMYGIKIKSQNVIKQNRRADEYFTDKIGLLLGLIVFSAGCHPALMMVSSRMFALDLLNSGLTKDDLNRLTQIKIKSTICFENIPQLIIQIVYSAQIEDITTATFLAFIGSVLSIILSASSYYAQTLHRKDVDIVSYYVRFANVVERAGHCKLTDWQEKNIEAKKGRKEQLQRAISKKFKISHDSLEIGYVTVMENGVELHVSHYVPRLALKAYNDKFNETHNRNRMYRMDVDAKQYIKQLYRVHEDGLSDAFRKHFVISDSNFVVQCLIGVLMQHETQRHILQTMEDTDDMDAYGGATQLEMAPIAHHLGLNQTKGGYDQGHGQEEKENDMETAPLPSDMKQLSKHVHAAVRKGVDEMKRQQDETNAKVDEIMKILLSKDYRD